MSTFLGNAGSEGERGGEFYTPRSVHLLVAMLEPYKGRVYDPCCGSGGMFVQSEKFVEEHGGRLGDIAIYGQESNYTTWRLAKMNLAVRGIDADIRWKFGVPPVANANFAWLQHIFHHRGPNGTAGVVLANGSMSSNASGEGEIRQEMVQQDIVDCRVALPGQLFYSTQIPACLWFLARNKNPGNGWRPRRSVIRRCTEAWTSCRSYPA